MRAWLCLLKSKSRDASPQSKTKRPGGRSISRASALPLRPRALASLRVGSSLFPSALSFLRDNPPPLCHCASVRYCFPPSARVRCHPLNSATHRRSPKPSVRVVVRSRGPVLSLCVLAPLRLCALAVRFSPPLPPSTGITLHLCAHCASVRYRSSPSARVRCHPLNSATYSKKRASCPPTDDRRQNDRKAQFFLCRVDGGGNVRQHPFVVRGSGSGDCWGVTSRGAVVGDVRLRSVPSVASHKGGRDSTEGLSSACSFFDRTITG
jgi:hypothetical protein